jgi:Ca2+/Na+ antiporter
MENSEVIDNTTNTEGAIFLSENSANYLTIIAKWTYFLSILGFIGIGIFILAAFAMMSFMPDIPNSPLNGSILGIMYLAMAVFYFLPVLYLYKFSVKIRKGINADDQDHVEEALKYLKSHFKFIGILTIIMIGLYILAIIGGVVFGAMGAAAL